MLKIEAIFRPERVNAVIAALLEVGVTGLHYQNVTGQGQQQGVEVVTARGGQSASRFGSSQNLARDSHPRQQERSCGRRNSVLNENRRDRRRKDIHHYRGGGHTGTNWRAWRTGHIVPKQPNYARVPSDGSREYSLEPSAFEIV